MSGYQVNGMVTLHKYFSSLNMLWMDDAAEWAKSYSDVVRLLGHSAFTQNTVEPFKFLFSDKFPSGIVEVVLVFIDDELAELKQKKDESLIAFYKRVTSLMQHVGVKDKPTITKAININLSPLESAILDTILRAFIREIDDSER